MGFRTGLVLSIGLLAGQAAAQGTEVGFGPFAHDSTQPVEITAESLSVDQADGTAVFAGNVLVGQGDMRLAASEVRVRYAESQGTTQGRIESLLASGGVTLVSGQDAAEASEAVYTVDSGTIVMSGDVVVTQGRLALSSQKLTVDLNTGRGLLEGGVRTVLQPATAP